MPIANDSNHINVIPSLLREFEQKLAHAYAAFGDLAGALPRARAEADIPQVVGHTVITATTEAGLAVSTAMARIAAVHKQLEKVARHYGLEQAIGDVRPKPTDPFTSAELLNEPPEQRTAA